jgi:hypothetical protein
MAMKKTLLVSLILFLNIVMLRIHGIGAQENLVVNSEEKKEVIDSIAKLLKDIYVFPETSKQMTINFISQVLITKFTY